MKQADLIVPYIESYKQSIHGSPGARRNSALRRCSELSLCYYADVLSGKISVTASSVVAGSTGYPLTIK